MGKMAPTINRLTVSSNPSIYPMIEVGDYLAYHQQMSSSVYGKNALTYRITTMDGNTLIPPQGGENKYTKKRIFQTCFFIGRIGNGTATKASAGCLLIDGRSWRDVEKQLGKSRNIFIQLNRKR